MTTGWILTVVMRGGGWGTDVACGCPEGVNRVSIVLQNRGHIPTETRRAHVG